MIRDFLRRLFGKRALVGDGDAARRRVAGDSVQNGITLKQTYDMLRRRVVFTLEIDDAVLSEVNSQLLRNLRDSTFMYERLYDIAEFVEEAHLASIANEKEIRGARVRIIEDLKIDSIAFLSDPTDPNCRISKMTGLGVSGTIEPPEKPAA